MKRLKRIMAGKAVYAIFDSNMSQNKNLLKN